jgi:hypothetical protein
LSASSGDLRQGTPAASLFFATLVVLRKKKSSQKKLKDLSGRPVINLGKNFNKYRAINKLAVVCFIRQNLIRSPGTANLKDASPNGDKAHKIIAKTVFV